MYRKSAIVGIGQTDISRKSGRTEWELALEASLAAIRDAGLEPSEIDGIVRFTLDNVNEHMMTRSLGVRDLRHFSQVGYGGMASSAVIGNAAAAIAAGQASAVLVYRSLNVSSGVRYGRAERVISVKDGLNYASGPRIAGGAFTGPYGMLVPGHALSVAAARYRYEHGLTDDQLTETLGRIAVQQREYAQTNPRALTNGRPLSMEEYRASRIISTPLRLFDYCLETDGAIALVLVDADRARALRRDPAYVLSANQSMVPDFAEPISVYKKDICQLGPASSIARLYEDARIQPSDLAFAQLYDSFSPLVLFHLETYGIAPRGQGWKYLIEQGIGPDSPLPANTHGGHLSEGYLHGMNHVTEAVRQLRGQATNQVHREGPALVASNGMSALVLDR